MTMRTLRQTERDLYDAADELRDEAAEIKEQIETLEEQTREEFDGPNEIPQERERQYQQLRQQYQELIGTADTYEHYAEEWSDDDECVFVMEELNGDEFAAVIDAVSQEAGNQARAEGSLPEGYGRIKALEFGVTDVPEYCSPTPGEWPAAIVNELFEELNDITSPAEVDLGNESLRGLWDDETETPVAVDESVALESAGMEPATEETTDAETPQDDR